MTDAKHNDAITHLAALRAGRSTLHKIASQKLLIEETERGLAEIVEHCAEPTWVMEKATAMRLRLKHAGK